MGFKSLLLLGTHWILHLVSKLAFWRRHHGLAFFLETYREDNIAPTPEIAAKHLIDWLRCTNCGLCDISCPLQRLPSSDRLSPSQLASFAWRDVTVHRLVATAAQSLASCQECRICEGACPEAIPLIALAAWVAQCDPNPGAISHRARSARPAGSVEPPQ